MQRIVGALRPSQRALSFPPRVSGWLAASIGVVAFVLSACGGGNGLTSPASVENVTRTYSVYALSGTASALPAAFQFTSESLTRPQVLPSGSINFDVAFDIGTDGRVRILPARVVTPSPPNGSPSIGVLKVAGAFDALSRAPDRGYLSDSIAVAAIGDTYVFELRQSGCIYQEPFYAKLTVDSIITAERRIVFRSLVNRNCSFRGLSDGLPKN
ncbi:MAG: hypothetical protein ABIW79_05220 [Gemmatimonas sp.]